MGQPWTHLLGKSVIDWDIVYGADVSVPNNGVETLICSLRLKNGKKPFVTAVKQAWDAGLDTFVKWTLKVDGNIHPRFPYRGGQIAPPETDYKLPVREEVNQGSLVEIWAYQSASGTTGNFTGVIEIEYEDY